MARESFERVFSKWKKRSLSYCRKRTAEMFQRYIRTKYARNGRLRCVTCGKHGPADKFDAGHFFSRRHNATLLDERNCYPQCKRCNRYLSGNMAPYTEFMMKEHGPEGVKRLAQDARKLKRFTRQELADKFCLYRDQIDEMEQQ